MTQRGSRCALISISSLDKEGRRVKVACHQLGPFFLRLADTARCWRSHNDLSLDNAKAVALPCGCVLGRRDLHVFVSTAASSGLCGCPGAAFSSDHVTLNNHHPGRRGAPKSVPCVHVCVMCRAKDPHGAFRTPLPQLPASSFSTSIYCPAQTFGIKIPGPLAEKAKTPFERNGRGR